MRLGQIEELLPPLHIVKPEDSARPDCDERLDNVKALAERIGLRIDKGQQQVSTPLHAEEHEVKHRERRQKRVAKIFHLHPGQVKHQRGDASADQRRTEVRLLQNQENKDQARQGRRKNRAAAVVDALHAILQEPRKKEHERGLGQLRWLKGQDDEDRKSTRLNSSHITISYAVFC